MEELKPVERGVGSKLEKMLTRRDTTYCLGNFSFGGAMQ
jgi:hypothetical protein